jgi:hypothetical protein
VTRRDQTERVSPRELLRWGSGGWVVWAAGLMCLAIVAWRGSVIVSQLDRRAVGDGENPASYGFDLSNLTVDGRTLVAGGYCKDGIPALTRPERLTVAEAAEFHRWLREEHRHKFIIPDDPVIGVVINGEAMAYPTRLLAWHQVVNDEVGGEPILVTYDPLCDSSAVFSRRVGDETPEFGVSGLLLDSNLIFYDRRPEHVGESLWSQLQFGAIAGPKAGTPLELLPFTVMSWVDWTRKYPQTRVMKLDVNRIRVYRNTFAEYLGSDQLRFPVDSPLPDRALRAKAPMWALRDPTGVWRHIPCDSLRRLTPATDRWIARVGEVSVPFFRSETSGAVWPELIESGAGEAGVRAVSVMRFAWYGQHPESEPLVD